MNFVRGIEPLRSMKIGIVTWNNLSAGCFLKSRRWVPLTGREDGSFRFTSDRAKQDARILALETLIIENIERKKLSILRVKYSHNKGTMHLVLEGSVERFRKYFDIIQER